MTKHRTVEQALARGLRAYAGRPSEKTNRALAGNLRRGLGSTRLTRLSNGSIRLYRQLRASEGAKAATVNREVGLLRAILRAQEVRNLPTQWGGQPEAIRHRTLSVVEARALLQYLGERCPWAGLVTRVLLGTGARAGEILGASWQHVRLDEGRILVPTPKEGQPKILILRSEALRAARLAADGSASDPSSERAFGRPGRSQAQDYANLRYWLRSWSDAAEVERLTPHDLRRSYASWALQDGATLDQIGQVLGHQNVQTTRRAYARIDAGVRSRVAEMVERRLAS